MSWREEFQTAAITLLVQKGSLVREDGSYYGWEDFDAMRHVRPWSREDGEACRFVRARNVREDYWSEFVDTFNGSRDVTGISCDVDCACGRFVGRQLRFSGRIHELLQELLQFTQDQEFDLTTANQEDDR